MSEMNDFDEVPADIREVLPALRPAAVSLGAIRGATGSEVIESATAMASALADIIDKQGLYKNIQGRNHVLVDGWTTAAALCGLMPREVACEVIEGGAYVAVVSLVRINDGVELTRASAECGGEGDEIWQKRAAYARRSMAITRATSKVCRIALSWVVTLAGYSGTPAEEMEQAEREIAQRKPVPEKPMAELRTIGEDKKKKVWKVAAVRVGELIARGDLPPNSKPDTIMRDILKAWALEHTADIPTKQYDAFEALVLRWMPGMLPDEMAAEAAF
jgi:hypothetical protein